MRKKNSKAKQQQPYQKHNQLTTPSPMAPTRTTTITSTNHQKNINNQNIREHTKKKDQNSIAIFATSMVKHLNNWQVPKTLDHSNCKIYVKHISGVEAVCMQDNQNHD